MKTITDICFEMGDRFYTNEHIFAWLSQMLADDGVVVASEFPFAVGEDGSFTVTITARRKEVA